VFPEKSYECVEYKLHDSEASVQGLLTYMPTFRYTFRLSNSPEVSERSCSSPLCSHIQCGTVSI
jgi:hypothetical protein